jgi:hypothetical protein
VPVNTRDAQAPTGPVPCRRNLPSTIAARPHVGQYTTPFMAEERGRTGERHPRSPNLTTGLCGHTAAPSGRAAAQPFPPQAPASQED